MTENEPSWINILLGIIAALFGSSGFYQHWLARKERKAAALEKEANAKLTNVGAFEKLQGMYEKFLDHYEKDKEKALNRERERDKRIRELNWQLNTLRSIIQRQNELCHSCPNLNIETPPLPEAQTTPADGEE